MVSSFLSKGFFLLLKLLPYKGFFSWFPKYWKYHIYSWKKKTVPNHHCLLVTAKLHHEVFATFLSSLKNKYGKTGTQIQMRKTKKYLWILASLILALRGWPVSGSFYSAFVPPFATTAATVLSIWYCPTPELTWKTNKKFILKVENPGDTVDEERGTDGGPQLSKWTGGLAQVGQSSGCWQVHINLVLFLGARETSWEMFHPASRSVVLARRCRRAAPKALWEAVVVMQVYCICLHVCICICIWKAAVVFVFLFGK